MARLTITLSDERYRALALTAARRQQSMTEVIVESLASYGIRSHESATEIVARARVASRMSEREAGKLALREVQAERPSS
jgi:predicted transcriptional regulator